MKFFKEMNELADLLAQNGLDNDDAADFVVKAAKRSRTRKVSLVQALKSYANPSGYETSKTYQLHIALNVIGDSRLNKFDELTATQV